MPRTGLTTGNAAAAAASRTGQTGSGNLTVGLIARRPGIRPPGIAALPGLVTTPRPGSLRRWHRRPGSPRSVASAVPR